MGYSLKPYVLVAPFVDVPAEVIEQELAQGHWSQSLSFLNIRSKTQSITRRIIALSPAMRGRSQPPLLT